MGTHSGSGVERGSAKSSAVNSKSSGAARSSFESERLDSYGLDDPLPTPSEQLSELVLWMGQRQPDYTTGVKLEALELAAWLGAPLSGNPDSLLGWLIRESEPDKLIEKTTPGPRLTLNGWERFAQLRRTVGENKTAFMAMKFDKEDLDTALTTCFKPAAAAAGFDLRALTEGQSAGIIDDQLRVALRRARFVISDLTYGSRGAYWEAGFAEGSEKPVIYTCKRDWWEKEHVHFDTNHLATIIWSLDDLPTASAQLKAMIRATLPAEARMPD